MRSEKQTIPFSIRFRWAQLLRAEWLAACAIGGYLVFLPLQTKPDLSTLVLVLFGLLAIHVSTALRPQIGRSDRYVISALLLAIVCSSILSDEPLRGLYYLVYACLNVFLLLLVTTVNGKTMARIVAVSLAAFGVLHLAALLMVSAATGDVSASALVGQARMSTLIVPNDALILGLCLPSLAFLLMDGENRVSPGSYFVLALYLLLSVYVSYRLQSKMAFLSLMTALFVMTIATALSGRPGWFREHRTLVLVGTIPLMLLMGAAAWILGNQSTTRLSLWAEAGTAHTSVSAVVFGTGPNTFLFHPFAAEWGFERGDYIIPWAHNLYLEAYSEQGLFGLAAIILFSLIPIWRATQIKDSKARALILATAVTFCLVALFEITLTRRFYFALLALLYGLSAVQEREGSND